MLPRFTRVTGVLTLSLIFALVALGPARGDTCKKFKNGMTISDCPDSGCGGAGAKLNMVKNRHTNATSPTSMTLDEIISLNSASQRVPLWRPADCLAPPTV